MGHTKDEIKTLLKGEIKAVNESRLKVIIGVILFVLVIVLVLLSFLSIYTLIFTLPLLHITRKHMVKFRLKKMMYIITRCLIDDEYADKIINN